MADKPFSALGADVRLYAANLDHNASRVMRRVALACDQALVLATPVDTGRARSNWQMSLHAPIEGVISSYVFGQKGSTGPAVAGLAMEQAKTALEAHKSGVLIHLVNNVEYMPALNAGHSAQAPALFIQKGISAAVDAFNSVGSGLLLRKL
jgi:hypothetical protein